MGATPQRLKKYQHYRKVSSYGIDVQTYDRLLSEQDERCGLCGEKMDPPCIDHNHDTNEVRGLLCNGCNLTLGQIELSGGKQWLDRACSWVDRVVR